MGEKLLLHLVLLLATAKIFEKIFGYIRVNPVVAHVIAGLIIGPYVLNFVSPSEPLGGISYLGLMLLVFYTGLTTSFREVKKVSLWVILVGFSGVVITFTLCFSILILMSFDFVKSLILSILLSNTATEVVAVTVSRTANNLIKSVAVGASVVDDILVIITLGVITSSLLDSGDNYRIVGIVTLSTTLFIGILTLSSFLVSRPELFYRRLATNRVAFASTSIILTSVLALVTRFIGLNELIGIYLAGLIISRGRECRDPLLLTNIALAEFIDQLKIFIESLALPLFFTYVGLLITPASMNTMLYLTLLAIALAGKIIGCGVPVYAITKNKFNAIAIGLAMTGRGALETALLKLLLDIGMINMIEYTTILFIALTTTILTPAIYSLTIEQK